MKRKLTALLDRIFPEYESLFDSVFGKASITVLRKYPIPQKVKNAHLEKLTELLMESSGGHFGEWKARQLKAAAYNSFGIEDSCGVYSALLGMFLEQILSLTERADVIEKQIALLLKEFDSQLTSIPGGGTVLAATILSKIGDISRSSSSDKLLAYAGLDPSVKQSGEFKSNQNRMSKRGSPYLRCAIWLASTAAVQCDPMFRAYYEEKIPEGLYYKNEINRVSRKLSRQDGVARGVSNISFAFDKSYMYLQIPREIKSKAGTLLSRGLN